MALAFSKVNICLTDIPKRLIRTDESGRKYIELKIVEKKTPDVKEKYTYTHFIAVAGKQEDFQPGEKSIIGNAGNWNDTPQTDGASQPNTDLPF